MTHKGKKNFPVKNVCYFPAFGLVCVLLLPLNYNINHPQGEIYSDHTSLRELQRLIWKWGFGRLHLLLLLEVPSECQVTLVVFGSQCESNKSVACSVSVFSDYSWPLALPEL